MECRLLLLWVMPRLGIVRSIGALAGLINIKNDERSKPAAGTAADQMIWSHNGMSMDDEGPGSPPELLRHCQRRVDAMALAATDKRAVDWFPTKTSTGVPTVDFEWNGTAAVRPKKYTSRDAVRLLQHRRVLFVGNSMLHRLAEAVVFLLGCCGDDTPHSLANGGVAVNSVSRAGQMIWHHGMSMDAVHGEGNPSIHLSVRPWCIGFAMNKCYDWSSTSRMTLLMDWCMYVCICNRRGSVQRLEPGGCICRGSEMGDASASLHVPHVQFHRRGANDATGGET